MRFRALIVVCVFACRAAAEDAPPPAAAGTRVTLKAVDLPVADVVAKFNALGINKLDLTPADLLAKPPLSERRISVDFSDLPWLAAADEIGRLADLTLQVQDSRCVLTASRPGNRLFKVSSGFAGPIGVACQSIAIESAVQYGSPHVFTKTADLMLTVVSEPSTPLIGIDSQAGFVSATDENAVRLEGPATEPDKFIVIARQARVNIALPDRTIKKLSTLDLRVGIHTVGATQQLAIADVLNTPDEAIDFAGAKVRVTDVKPANPAGFEFKLVFTGGAVKRNVLSQLRIGAGKYTPRSDGDGVRGPRVTNVTGVNDEVIVTLQVTPEANGPTGAQGRPVAPLDWLIPTAVHRHIVPVTVKDVPLWR